MQDKFKLYFLTLFILTGLGLWMQSLGIESISGRINFSLGLVMIAAFIIAKVLQFVRLPLISGYILAGIIAGPFVSGFFSEKMVAQMGLIDDLALGFIALTAGGSFNLKSMQGLIRPIILNVCMHVIVIFPLIFFFVILAGKYFSFTNSLNVRENIVMGLLLGVIAIARSPSSAIAIIRECRAKGVFTRVVLGVTIAIDVLIIILFTLAITIARIIMQPGTAVDLTILTGLLVEIAGSLILGFISGKIITLYIEKAGHDLSLFLLFFALVVTKTALWFGLTIQTYFGIHLHLEPLLICMATGFTVCNIGNSGDIFMESLEKVSLPIYVLFFTLAGAALNLKALMFTWPLALALGLIRVIGIMLASWSAGVISGASPRERRIAWMAYLTQAGVAIGLARLAEQQFPEIGLYMTTIVLAVITINQIIGPITFKAALTLAGDVNKIKK